MAEVMRRVGGAEVVAAYTATGVIPCQFKSWVACGDRPSHACALVALARHEAPEAGVTRLFGALKALGLRSAYAQGFVEAWDGRGRPSSAHPDLLGGWDDGAAAKEVVEQWLRRPLATRVERN